MVAELSVSYHIHLSTVDYSPCSYDNGCSKWEASYEILLYQSNPSPVCDVEEAADPSPCCYLRLAYGGLVLHFGELVKLLHNHIVLPEELTLNRDISFMAKGLYAYLLLERDATPKGIAMTMRENEETVLSALKELRAVGYIDFDHESDSRALKPDKRDPEVQELVEYFEAQFELKMPRAQFQRRAAKTLIQQKGLLAAKRAVDAALAVRGIQYAPRILSLEDLRDKWNGLADYYRRESRAQFEQRKAEHDIKKMMGA